MYDEQRRVNESYLWRFLGQEYRRFDYGQSVVSNYGNVYTGLISNNPVFLDLGAFKGNWSREMVSRYGGCAHLFEIQPNLIKNLKDDFANTPNCTVHSFGLGPKDELIDVGSYDDGEGFSLSKPKSVSVSNKVQLKSFLDFVIQNNIDEIDVCKINIEGAEYDLLENMIENNLHMLCRNIQVEFHRQYPVPDWYGRYNAIRNNLLKTHVPTLDYYFSWQNWCRKE